jgi:hypothetical protein
MKMLLTILAIALLASSVVHADADEHETFNQLVVFMELDDDAKRKLAIAFVTLEENLDAATAGVGSEDFDPLDLIDAFYTTRVTFRDNIESFLSQDQIKTMQKYASAIFYELADDIARMRVTRFKESLKLTEDQMTASTLVVNEDLRNIVATCLEYNEKDFNDAVADAMRKDVVEIREDTRAQIKKILTEDQWTKLQKM